jgi:hypothetical protein
MRAKCAKVHFYLHGLLPRDWVADDNNDSAGLSRSRIQRRRGRVRGTLTPHEEIYLTAAGSLTGME